MAIPKPIIYEPHPVSAERKREIIEAGFMIVDARFAPDNHQDAESKPKKRGPYKKRSATDEPAASE